MTKQTKNEIAKANNNILDISAFGSFQMSDITPSTLVLVQGNNALKDSIGCKNGDFVADNMTFGTEVEFIPIASETFFDVFVSDPTIEGGAPREDYVETIKETHTIYTADGRVVDLTPLNDTEMFPIVFLGNNGRYYQRKKVLIIAVNGMPYRMVFKSQAKHIASKKIGETILKACKHQGLSDPIEGVFKIFSTELQGKRGKFFSMSCAFIRKATDEELAAVAPYRTIDMSKVKESELGE